MGDFMFKRTAKKRAETNTNDKSNDNKNNDKDKGSNKKSPTGQYKLNTSLEDNINLFKHIFSNDETLIVREFGNKWLKAAKCCIIYLEGMVDAQVINESIILPILRDNLSQEISSSNLLEELCKKVIVVNRVSEDSDVNTIVSSVLYGDTILFVEGYDKALLIHSKGWKTRAIIEPVAERIVRGPREGFNESIMVNVSLIRRKIKNSDLKFQFREIGTKTHTKTCICYIEGIVSRNILKTLEKRLDEIDIDGILDSGYIQELIRDAPFSPFETVGYSERPDVIAAKLLEGRIALIVDGSPIVLTVPYVMVENTQSNEDYYNNYIFGSINRLMRAGSALLAISVPAVYISLVTYHQEMIPTALLLNISAARQGVPIPTVVSIFLMMIIFDVLREAGTRMPTPIGQAVNIVGTLILGQAAVEAKLVSAPIIIMTALTGILTLMNVKLINATIILRFSLLALSSVLGLYGYLMGMLVINMYLMSMRSFGVPYMLSTTSVKNHNGQDAWIRAPWWEMTLRPKIIAGRNLIRQKNKKAGGQQGK
jgi:spore germination protein KA